MTNPLTSSRQYYTSTQGMCNICGRLAAAKVIFAGGKVYMEKYCPEHGLTQSLIFSDADKYRALAGFVSSGKTPLKRNGSTSQGCPYDCGLCPEHAQHTCLPIVEITNRCNLRCPICIADNGGHWDMEPESFGAILDNLIACEGKIDVLNISGGEPTLHPRFKKLVEMACRPEIAAVSVSTNGLLFLEDDRLLDFLAKHNVFVALQFDGFSDQAWQSLRGRPLLSEKLRVLEKLKEYKIQASLVMTAALGVNDSEIAEVTRYFMDNGFIRSLMIQPLSVQREMPEDIPFDPMERLTIPDVIPRVAAGTDGLMNEEDILPLPCSHPACFHLAYLLDLGEGEYVPLNRLFPVEQYLDVIRDRAFFGLDQSSLDTVQALVYQLWSSAGTVPVTAKILNAVRELLREISVDYTPRKAMNLGSARIKSIFIHHFMDRYNFDLSRAHKCCQHYPKEGQKLWTCCVYNTLNRERS